MLVRIGCVKTWATCQRDISRNSEQIGLLLGHSSLPAVSLRVASAPLFGETGARSSCYSEPDSYLPAPLVLLASHPRHSQHCGQAAKIGPDLPDGVIVRAT